MHDPSAPIPLSAVILCGGNSRRMGRSKAWLPFGEETLLARTVRRLRDVTSQIVVVGAVGQELPPLPDDVVVAHDTAADLGPVVGLAVGLKHAAQHSRLAFVCATDTPFIEGSVVRALAARIEEHDVAIIDDGERQHPLVAVYRSAVYPIAENMIAAGERRLTRLVQALNHRVVSKEELLDDETVRAQDPELRSLRNVNTTAAYDAALGEWRQGGSPL